jgi:hypothetical protein
MHTTLNIVFPCGITCDPSPWNPSWTCSCADKGNAKPSLPELFANTSLFGDALFKLEARNAEVLIKAVFKSFRLTEAASGRIQASESVSEDLSAQVSEGLSAQVSERWIKPVGQKVRRCD